MKRFLIALPIGLVSLLVGGPATAVVGIALVAPLTAALWPRGAAPATSQLAA